MTQKLTVSTAKSLYAKMVKVAQDLLDVAENIPAPTPEQSEAGTAGPQEVVDAIEVVIDELEQISEAVPAEPAGGEEVVDPNQVKPEVEQPTEPIPKQIPEEDPKHAKQVKELTARLEAKDREELASKYAELFDEPKIQKAKYDEVISSKEENSIWTAKIDSIEQYKQNEGASTTKYAKAENMTSWIKPRSKFAKLVDNGLMNL